MAGMRGSKESARVARDRTLLVTALWGLLYYYVRQRRAASHTERVARVRFRFRG